MKPQLTKQLQSFIKKKYPKFKGDIILEYPPNQKMGDLAFPCFELAKAAKKSPNAIAQELAQEQNKLIAKAQPHGPYLNLFLNKESVWKEILSPKKHPTSNIQHPTKIMLEFSSPNTNKPLHLGHVRNNTIGDSLANLLNSQGHKVTRASLVNDRGVHICKSMLAYQKVKSGEWKLSDGKKVNRVNKAVNKVNNSYDSSIQAVKPSSKGDHIVGNYYVLYSQKEKDNPKLTEHIQELLKKWEAGDKEVIKLWKKLNKMVLKGHDQTYKQMGIKFDKTYFESQEFENGKKIILSQLKKKKCYKRKDGAIEIDLTKFGLDKKVLLRADGTSVYITQDIGLAVNRQKNLNLNKIIYVVGNEQDYHFKVLFKILELFGYKWAKNLHHLSYAMVNLTSGKLKSREGKTVDADNLMEQMHELAKSEIKKRESKLSQTKLKKRAEAIGLGAMKFYLLKHSPTQTITYNPKDSISFEGATGPYVQYTYARIQSILQKSQDTRYKIQDTKKSQISNSKPLSIINYQLLNTSEEWEVGKLLSQYQEVIAESANEYNPSKLATYLLDLSQSFNTFYHKHKVIGAKNKELAQARLILITKTADTLKTGLNLLGINVVEKM